MTCEKDVCLSCGEYKPVANFVSHLCFSCDTPNSPCEDCNDYDCDGECEMPIAETRWG